ncbi:MAG TPA: hypothetical protein VHZ97_26780 [Pseudonocardiaceae bacterium]|jgi:hypothetical protein|nr:hypothetical protein [Pseudonocardiaceae bacterium]
MTLFKQAWHWMRDVVEEQAELQERAALLSRPWAEDYLHWSARDGRLHGHLMPPRGWRRYSVTRSGWCQHGYKL